ncbi:choice-of-anchor D domain-containing protein, partial [Kaistella sp.]|uniref:choice-of-anchor D domain-containing protein n=1 Tax=Kaistella sp. TaxID=2782235 RepID=UPI002F94B192
MKKSLFSKRNRFVFFLLMMISGSIFSQISLVNYPFTGNTLEGGRTFESTLQTQPPNINYFSGSTVVTPGFNNNRVQYSNIGDYIEITLDTRGFSNISLDFDAFYRYTAIVGTGTWKVSYSVGGAYQTLSEITLTDTSLFHPGETSGHYSDTLPVAANNQQNLKIRITSSDWSIFGTSYLYIDNINISAGNAVIGVYNQDNDTIPHLSVASYSYDTDFGTVQTTVGSVQKTYTIRNTGSIALEISSIELSGQNPADFQLSNIPASVPAGASRNFTVTFDPFDDGVRTADILIYSNSSPNPYQFNVQGRGASCVLVPSAFRQNTFSTGTPSLTTTGNFSPVTGNSGTNYYPRNSNMHILNGTDTRSWIVNNTQQTLEFGPVNIANEKNVSISFYVAAATSGNNSNGVNGSSYITLSVYNPLTSSWSDEMRLRGSGGTNTNYYYPYSSTAGEFNTVFDGDDVVEQRTNGGSTGNLTGKISRFKLDIPGTFGSELRFKINAYTSGSNRFWLIDEVAVNSENTVTKTFTAANVWVPSAPNADEKAIILGSYTVPAANLNVCECEVGEAGTVTIPNGRTLNVKGKITNHGNGDNFTVKTGGHLIQIEDGAVNTGSITAERLVSDINNISTHMDYLYWSAPVTGQNLQDFSPGTPANRIFQYNEPNDLFKAVPLATEPNFVPGKGYAFRAESGTGILNPYSKTYKFKG